MKKQGWLLWFIILITLISLLIDLCPSIDWQLGKSRFYRDLEIKKGIDLAGGAHLVFQADMTTVGKEDQDSALKAAAENIQRRVNLFGISEATVQTSQLGENHRLIVELPGVEDVSQAIDLIGQTAQLDFRELKPEASQSPPEVDRAAEATAAVMLADYQPTGLTGKDLTRSQVQFNPNTGQPVVGLRFSDEGAQKFSAITQRNVGKPVAIFLDELPVTIPLVQEAITTGEAIISGEFTPKQAKKLSIQLNAGALPVSIEIIQQRNIGATLGTQSVQKSLQAGLIGLLMVVLFMAAYYGRLGILADMGLVVYGLVTLALYKLIPVTLTLPGVAGFLLSVGMAVDSNILVFERMKEEQRAGKPRKMAMELGFGRAWDSIRDANVCTLITCFILFNPFSWSFLNTSGMVRGFALTLGLGVLLSLFTGVVVTRTILMRTFTKEEKT